MKILVGAKRVVDANVKVRVKADNSNVDTEHSKMSLNPFDENAIEEAVRLKELGIASEIVVLSIGVAKCEEVLRSAMARGCDRAILIETKEDLEPINIAKIYAKIYAKENPDLVLLGKQAIDNNANQVAQMLAGILDIPQATFASKVTIQDKKVRVEKEIENGKKIIEVDLPAVLTADLYLNEPRFIKLPQLMQAKKKTIEKINLEDLNIALKPCVSIIQVRDGEVKKQCKYLTSVAELANIIDQVRG